MPKIGFLPSRSLHGVDGVADGCRVAGAVREEDAVGLVAQDLLGRRGAGHDRDLAADLRQAAEDVPLHAEVEGDDVLRRPAAPAARARRTAPKPSVPVERLRPARPRCTRSRPTMPGQACAFVHQRGVVEVGGREDAVHRPADAQPADQGPGVDALDADDVAGLQVVVEVAVDAEVARHAASARGRRSPATCTPRDSCVVGG